MFELWEWTLACQYSWVDDRDESLTYKLETHRPEDRFQISWNIIFHLQYNYLCLIPSPT
jgi:hypothetical protein